MLEALEAVKGRVGLEADGLDGGIELLEAAGDAHEGAAGAEAGDKVSDPAGGLLPDLGAGGVVVGQPVGVVGVLVDVAEAVGVVAGQFAGAANGAVGALVGIGPLHASAVGAENALALRRDVGGHGELDGKAEGRAEHGEGDAGVAAAGVEEGLAGDEQAAVAGVARPWRRRRGL